MGINNKGLGTGFNRGGGRIGESSILTICGE